MSLDNLAKDITNILIISGAAGSVLGILVIFIRISNGVKCLLRADMLRTYYRHLDDKTIRQYEKENFEYSYSAYKALKGNSFIDDIHKKVDAWTIVS